MLSFKFVYTLSAATVLSTMTLAGATTPLPTQLHPNGDASKCLEVRGSLLENGTPVQIYDCNGAATQNWLIDSGKTHVQVNGTKYCLDAGANPENGIGLKIWECYDGLPAQAWNYTTDGKITLEGQHQCLDLPNGAHTSQLQVQTWQCSGNNTNQIWTKQSEGLPVPETGSYCCPLGGPQGLNLTSQHDGAASVIACDYLDKNGTIHECQYDRVVGTNVTAVDGCPTEGLKTPYSPKAACPIA